MKNLILLLTTAMSLMTFAQNDKTDVEEEFLKGKVKSLRHISYSVKDYFGTTKKDSIIEGENYLYLFNPNGYFIESITYNPDNTIYYKNTHTHNNKNKYIEGIQVDEKGELTAKIIPVHNKKEQMTELNTYNKDGELLNKTTFEYDKDGNRTKETYYYANGAIYNQKDFTHNKKGEEIKVKQHNYDEEFISEAIHHFDNEGNKTRYDFYYYDLDKNLLGKGIFKYNDKEDYVEVNTFDEKNKPTGTTYYFYEYDKHNNWTKRTITEGSIAISITEREISYYE